MLEDKKAQMHLMEVVSGVILILVATTYISTIITPSKTIETVTVVHENVGADALRTLEAGASESPLYNSKLDEMISTYDLRALALYLDSIIAPDLSFNVIINAEGESIVLMYMGEAKGESSSVHHLTYLSGGQVWDISDKKIYTLEPGTYDVQILMWQEPRDLSKIFGEITDGYEYSSIEQDPYLETSKINGVEIAGSGDRYVRLATNDDAWEETTSDDFRSGNWNSNQIDVYGGGYLDTDGAITLDDYWPPSLPPTRTFTPNATRGESRGVATNKNASTPSQTPQPSQPNSTGAMPRAIRVVKGLKRTLPQYEALDTKDRTFLVDSALAYASRRLVPEGVGFMAMPSPTKTTARFVPLAITPLGPYDLASHPAAMSEVTEMAVETAVEKNTPSNPHTVPHTTSEVGDSQLTYAQDIRTLKTLTTDLDATATASAPALDVGENWHEDEDSKAGQRILPHRLTNEGGSGGIGGTKKGVIEIMGSGVTMVYYGEDARDLNTVSMRELALTNPHIRMIPGGYHITSTLTIEEDTCLSISKGTKLDFAPGAGLVVYGGLVVHGTKAEAVVFTSSGGTWNGIVFRPESAGYSCRIEGAVIKNADKSITCVDTSPIIVDSTLSHSTIAGVEITGDSKPVIIDSMFMHSPRDIYTKDALHQPILNGCHAVAIVDSYMEGYSDATSSAPDPPISRSYTRGGASSYYTQASGGTGWTYDPSTCTLTINGPNLSHAWTSITGVRREMVYYTNGNNSSTSWGRLRYAPDGTVNYLFNGNWSGGHTWWRPGGGYFVWYSPASVGTFNGKSADNITWQYQVRDWRNNGHRYFITTNVGWPGNRIARTSIRVYYNYNNPPNPPTLVSPANGATVYTLTPTLDWVSGGDPDGDGISNYYYQVDDNSNFNSPVIQGWVGSSTSQVTIPSGNLQWGKTYYWRVLARDNDAHHRMNSTYSAVWHFTTQSVNRPTNVQTAVRGADASSRMGVLDFSWDRNGNPNGIYYRVERQRQGSGWTVVYTGTESGLIAQGSRLHFFDYDLSDQTQYRYRVRAQGDASGSGATAWRTGGWVTTPDRTPPSAVTGLSASADNVHNRVNLTWNASSDSSGVVRYGLFRAQDSSEGDYVPVGGDYVSTHAYSISSGSGYHTVYTFNYSGDIMVDMDLSLSTSNNTTGLYVGIGDRNNTLRGAGVSFRNSYIKYWDVTPGGSYEDDITLLARYNANQPYHIRIYVTGNTATVYVKGRNSNDFSSGFRFDSHTDNGAIDNISDRTVKIAVYRTSGSITATIKNLYVVPLISTTSYLDTTGTDKAPPTVPTKGGPDPVDGSSTHDSGTWSANRDITIAWNASVDQGTTYYYYCVAYDKYGNDSSLIRNGGFEEGTAYWNWYNGGNGNSDIDINYRHSGWRAGKVTSITGGWAAIYRGDVPVQKPQGYIVLMHGLTSPGHNIAMFIGDYVNYDGYCRSRSWSGTGTWEMEKLYLHLPSAAPTTVFGIYVYGQSGGAGTSYYDDISAHFVSSATVTTGLAGYDLLLDLNATTDNPSPNVDVPATATSTTVHVNSGGRWYIHLKAGDNGGNWSAPEHFGGSGANDWFGILWGIFNEYVNYTAFDGSTTSPHVTNSNYGVSYATHVSTFETQYRYEGGYQGFDFVEFVVDVPVGTQPDLHNSFYGRLQFNANITQGTFYLANDSGTLVAVQTVTWDGNTSHPSTSTTLSASNTYVSLEPGCHYSVSGAPSAPSGQNRNGWVTVTWNIRFLWPFDDDNGTCHLYMRAKNDLGSTGDYYTNNGLWEDKSVSPWWRTENDLVVDYNNLSITPNPLVPTQAITIDGYVCFEGTSGGTRVLPPDGSWSIKAGDEDYDQTQMIASNIVDGTYYLGGGHFIFCSARVLYLDDPAHLPSPTFAKDTGMPSAFPKVLGSDGSGKSNADPPPALLGSISLHVYNLSLSAWQGWATKAMAVDYYPWYVNLTGVYHSNIYDAGLNVRWTYVKWDWDIYGVNATASDVSISVRIAVADNPSGPWTWSSSLTYSDGSVLDYTFPGGRYARYEVTLTSTKQTATPVLKSIELHYEYNALDGYCEYSTVVTEGEIIYARVYWVADIPPGTSVHVYVSRDGGTTKVEALKNTTVIFPAYEKIANSHIDNKLWVKVTLESDDTSRTPKIYYMAIAYMVGPPQT